MTDVLAGGEDTDRHTDTQSSSEDAGARDGVMQRLAEAR